MRRRRSAGGIEQLCRVLTLCLLLAGTMPAAAATPAIPVGSGTVDIPGAAPGGKALKVWTHRPAAYQPDDRIVMVLHGVRRNADSYRDNWVGLAEQHRLLVVVPEMSSELFPGDAGYNLGMMVDGVGRALPPERWAWGTLERAFDGVRAGAHSTATGYVLFGHSAGAQFAHRFALFADSSRAEVIIVANSGWYTLPMASEAFPYGLGGLQLAADAAARAFSRPMLLLLGEKDIDPRHKFLRRDADADRQGLNRLDRGRYFFHVAEAEAQKSGVAFRWRLETVPGVAHENDKMAAAAVRWLDSQAPGTR